MSDERPVIRQSPISYGATALATALLIYIGTFGSEFMVLSLFIVTLALIGIVMSRWGGFHVDDPSLDVMERRETWLWVAVSIVVIFGINIIVPQLPTSLFKMALVDPQKLAILLSIPTFRFSLGVMISVAEENFFRGFWGNLMLRNLPVVLAIPANSMLFTLYHIAVYGTSANALIIVFGAGIILMYAAYRSGYVHTTILAHMLVNALAFGVALSITTILLTMLIVGILLFLSLRRGGI
jgi:membrane protease YdiL (CAAX protease family)